MKRFWGSILFITLTTLGFSEEFLFDYEKIKNYVEERFLNARVEISPTPHIVIEDILPPEFYQELIDHWPEKTFEGIAFSWRKCLPIGNTNKWREAKDQSHELWRQFATHIVDEVMKKNLAKMFYPFLTYRFGHLLSAPVACHAKDVEEHRLSQDYGVGIGAHIDQAYIFSSVILYFPDPNDYAHKSLGTCLFSHKEGKTSPDFICESNAKVHLQKILPYQPNTLCAVLQTPSSWHSAVIHNPFKDYTRRLYLSLIFLTPEFMEGYYGTGYVQSIEPSLREWLTNQSIY